MYIIVRQKIVKNRKGVIQLKFFFNMSQPRQWKKDTEDVRKFEIEERLPGTDFFRVKYDDGTTEYKTGYIIENHSVILA